jgi:ATP-dependent RNA helicase RhlB
MQITADAEELGRYMDIKSLSVVGGIDYEKQRNQLGGRVDIIVATPGRLLDFCRSNVVDLKSVEILIIDEADRMLSMGFIPDVKSIISRTPRRENRQTQLFSATFSEDIRRLSEQWTNDPMRVDIEPEQLAVDSVDQRFFLTASDSKFDVLFNLINSDGVDRVIVFVNRRDQTRYLYERLQRYDISCGMLTGEVPQRKRISTLEKFKAGNTKVLVATDVAGRGIHVDNISHVVNYNMPEDPEDYVHRIGRTGRAGALGTSISLICEDDSFMMPQIETLLGEALNYQQPPEELLAEIPKPLRPAVPSTRPPSRHSSSGRSSSGRSSHTRSSNSRRR